MMCTTSLGGQNSANSERIEVGHSYFDLSDCLLSKYLSLSLQLRQAATLCAENRSWLGSQKRPKFVHLPNSALCPIWL